MADERDNCLYCRNKAVLDELMIKICDLDVSTLYLFREQTHKGRCVVAFRAYERASLKSARSRPSFSPSLGVRRIPCCFPIQSILS